MKKKNLIFTTLAFAVAIAACNKVDDSVLVSPKDSEQSESILSFEDENAFQAALADIRRNGDNTPRIITRAGGSDFVSLYDEFDQAMTEADDYYQREGGYEEFKAKFPDLYYPEYKEDYSAFLPVSDEDVAKLLNRQGKVLIAGEERDFRDVWSYDKIVELGLGMPEASAEMLQTKADDYVILTLDKQTVKDKRKVWITLRGIILQDAYVSEKLGRVDLCFRKKNALGWYNGKMTSESYILKNGDKEKEYYYTGGTKNLEYSPHKYSVAARPFYNWQSPYFGTHTFYFKCNLDDQKYLFTGKFTTDVDALLDMNNGTGAGEDILDKFRPGDAGIGLGYIFYYNDYYGK